MCSAARTISPDDPPASARRQDMRSGCAGHARSVFGRRASARAWARRACAGGARRASARARATSQLARRTSIRKPGMPHTLLTALLPLVRHKVRQSDSDSDSGWPDSGSESLGRLPPPGPGQRPSRPRRCCGTGYRKSEVTKSQRRKPRVHGNAFGGVQHPGNCMSRR